MSELLNFGHIYDAKYDKFGEYFHRIYDNDDFFSVTWENDLYHNEIVEPYDFYQFLDRQEIILIEDNSEKNRLFLRLKYGYK
jgi:hypothetical protein